MISSDACSTPSASAVGEELQAFIKRHGVDYERIIYVGDGSNDFCPAVKLRRYRPIWLVL